MHTLTIYRGDLRITLETCVAKGESFDDGVVKLSMYDEHNLIENASGQMDPTRVVLSFKEFGRVTDELSEMKRRKFSSEIELCSVKLVHAAAIGMFFISDANGACIVLSGDYVSTLCNVYMLLLGIEVLNLQASLNTDVFLEPITTASTFLVESLQLSICFSSQELFVRDLSSDRSFNVDRKLAERIMDIDTAIASKVQRRRFVTLNLENELRVTIAKRRRCPACNEFVFTSADWKFFADVLALFIGLSFVFDLV